MLKARKTLCDGKCTDGVCELCFNWAVWSVEWGGQIVMTCPLWFLVRLDVGEMLCTCVARTEQILAHALAATGNDADSGEALWFGCQTEQPVRAQDLSTLNGWQARCPGWKAHGAVEGGMGGGLLLEGDLWLHPQILAGGPSAVNVFRALLELPPLESLEVIWESEEEHAHANMCRAVSDA